jgi:hypothetical protein
MNAEQLTMLAYLGVKIPPQAWDAIFPMGPRISRAAREYFIAQALKGFSARLTNRKVIEQLNKIQKTLVDFAGGQLAVDYDDDDWCPTGRPRKIPVPHPFPWPWLMFSDELNPQPEPPISDLSKQIGGYLLLLSQATSQEPVAKQLETIGNSLMR